MRKRQLYLVNISMLVVYLVIRVYLHAFPNSDFFVLGYEVHHYFTGSIILFIAVVLFIAFGSRKEIGNVLCIFIGLSLALMLDELVFLIATDGTNTSYIQSVSFYGSIVSIGIASFIIHMVTVVVKDN